MNKNWLLGFIEAHGCFSVVLRKNSNTVGYQTIADFSLKVSRDDEEVLTEIQQTLDAGHVYTTKNQAILKATKLEDVRKIADFFDDLNFVSEKKKQQFAEWSKCIKIIETKNHLTTQGLLEVALIREKLHSKKQWNKKQFCDIRLELSPCHELKQDGSLPLDCSNCFDEYKQTGTVALQEIKVR